MGWAEAKGKEGKRKDGANRKTRARERKRKKKSANYN
jgi:hypothetical protein